MLRLINCDYIDGIRDIADSSIDLVVTDPPYKVLSGGNKNADSPKGILSDNDGKIFKHNDVDMRIAFREMFRVLKDNSHIYVMTNFINLAEFMRDMETAGFKIHNLLVWEKNNTLPNRWYMKNCEYTIFARKGKAKSIVNKGSQTVHRFNNTRDRIHPTQKPIDLMKFYVENSSDVGDVVLDPFMGSGSVGMACKETSREFIGFEIDPEYFERCKHNLETRRIVDF